MNLSHLLSERYPLSLPADIAISRLVLDSRLVQPGDLFFALSGSALDGRQFIDEAIQKGACAILADGADSGFELRKNVPVIVIPSLKNHVGKLAATFYEHPANKMRMIGVTGTSGKTSCTQFMAALFHHLNLSAGVIGTLGNGLYGHYTESGLTTPDAITLQKTLAELAKAGAVFTTMEVSSHSLDQGRVNGIEFEVGVFTNLTRDHLDYHHTMEAYGAAKKKLFDQAKMAVINADDAFGREMLTEFKSRKNVLSYSTETTADVYAKTFQFLEDGLHADIVTPWGNATLHSRLVGQFNLSNLLAVITTLGLLDIPLAAVIEGIATLQPIAGRMQSLGGYEKPRVVVDYAHKPDALEKVLAALRAQCVGKLYCLFGCGGDRDPGKRPVMAQIAERYADLVMVTDDNPRHENSTDIIRDIMRGFINPSKVKVEPDRAKAIREIIACAGSGDCVLIAGKGAETYQQIGDIKKPFSDVDKVKEALSETRIIKGENTGCSSG